MKALRLLSRLVSVTLGVICALVGIVALGYALDGIATLQLFKGNLLGGLVGTLVPFGVEVLEQNEEAYGWTALRTLDAISDDQKSDPKYLQARAVLEEAMKARALSSGFMAAAIDRVDRAPADQRQQVLKTVFLEGIEFYRKDPNCIPLRVYLYELVAKMDRPVPPSPESKEFEKKAQHAYQNARTRSDMLRVADEYERASRQSPWIGAYYKNLCTLYQLSGSFSSAAIGDIPLLPR